MITTLGAESKLMHDQIKYVVKPTSNPSHKSQDNDARAKTRREESKQKNNP